MRRYLTTPAWGALLAVMFATGAIAQSRDVLRTLNGHDTVKGTPQSKSYKILFDAYLDLPAPPQEVGDRFNLTTIHPKMSGWQMVSDWAESGQELADAILQCPAKNILGLPYGKENVERKYREAGLIADVAIEDSKRRTDFEYLDAVNVIVAYATAETYRRLESGELDEAVELAVALNWVLRQLCDREFFEEKWYSIQLLVQSLQNLRDMMYLYRDALTSEHYRRLAWYDLPGLRPTRERLQIPEGDRVLSEALLDAVFNNRQQADPEKFAAAFASIQSEQMPLTRFGAARRWLDIAVVHGSLEASKERLKLIYDDWWRRWRVQEYDPILDLETQFERTNPIRYAAVIYSMEDIKNVFGVRNQLIASVNGTAVAAGLNAYYKQFSVYPNDKEKVYGQFIRKTISDIDPYDEDFGPLRYRLLTRSDSIDVPRGRVSIPAKECLLYAVGQNHTDDGGREHVADASTADYVIWPPLRALARQQGLVD